MRIAVFAPDLGSELGGVFTLEQDILGTLLEMAPSSHHEFLIYVSNAKKASFKISSVNVRIVELKKTRFRLMRFARLFHRLQDHLLEGRPFYFRTWFEKSLIKEKADFAYFPTNRYLPPNIPFLFTVLDLEHMRYPGFPEVTLNGEWKRRRECYFEIVPEAALLIAPNEMGKQQIINYFQISPERIFPLRYCSPRFAINGASEPRDPSILKKFNLKNPFVFYPAKFYPHKNHVGVLYGLKRLKEKYQLPMEIVFVGPDGGNLAHVKKVAADLKISDSVHFLGFVEVADLVQLYKHAVALTFLSHFGPSNIPPLEAVALGCPVINANYPGAEEELGDAGVFIDPTDSDQLADAIYKVHTNDTLRQELIEKGLKRSRQWTMNDYVAGVFTCFDQYEKIRRCWA